MRPNWPKLAGLTQLTWILQEFCTCVRCFQNLFYIVSSWALTSFFVFFCFFLFCFVCFFFFLFLILKSTHFYSISGLQ